MTTSKREGWQQWFWWLPVSPDSDSQSSLSSHLWLYFWRIVDLQCWVSFRCTVKGFSCTYIYCCCSVAKSCLTLCYPMDCSTPAVPVLHCLPELAQTHIHWVGDAIQPSRPLSPASPFALNLSQHQGLFQWVGSSHQVAQVLSFSSSPSKNIKGWFPLRLTGLISLLSRGLSRVLSSTTVWKHQFFGAQPLLWSSSHIPAWLLEKDILFSDSFPL